MWENCTACGKCVEACPAAALEMTCRTRSVESVMQEVLPDIPFYKSDGGMTVSGGEPMLQGEFTAALLQAAKEAGIRTAVDTAGNVPFERYEAILPYCDLFLFDLKSMDTDVHKKATGVGNERILQNLQELARCGAKIWIRIPVIPGINDSQENMQLSAAFLSELDGIERVELLTYHRLGGGKYESLGMEYPSQGLEPLNHVQMNRLGEFFTACGLPLKVS